MIIVILILILLIVTAIVLYFTVFKKSSLKISRGEAIIEYDSLTFVCNKNEFKKFNEEGTLKELYCTNVVNNLDKIKIKPGLAKGYIILIHKNKKKIFKEFRDIGRINYFKQI